MSQLPKYTLECYCCFVTRIESCNPNNDPVICKFLSLSFLPLLCHLGKQQKHEQAAQEQKRHTRFVRWSQKAGHFGGTICLGLRAGSPQVGGDRLGLGLVTPSESLSLGYCDWRCFKSQGSTRMRVQWSSHYQNDGWLGGLCQPSLSLSPSLPFSPLLLFFFYLTLCSCPTIESLLLHPSENAIVPI
ncbi:hypothetical protein BDB00DRAFT_420579 [Zychaea mexicana]|uniref:uncharacterized protein n=1 Tax=Zychaea mexicana TaxID=64656 RepID=UPI0022FE6BD0|nr:uncharacterized protein BDB00DRAFT_420579 [Zychaea mexicana]KAI9492681.1 hypothetical protein BDB00DRAFT_420579 [Zychaea mexicana]